MSTGDKQRTAAVIVAAGKGMRMGASVPKQYLKLAGQPILRHTVSAFEASNVDDIIIVCPNGDEEYVRDTIIAADNFRKIRAVIPGGGERFDSSWCGIRAAAALEPAPGVILIHDGVRALIEPELINSVISALDTYDACCPAVRVKDTIRRIGPDGYSCGTIAREELRAIQTPQGFRTDVILTAYREMENVQQTSDVQHEQASCRPLTGITDDAMLVECYTSTRVYLIDGDEHNIKITTPEDMLLAETIIEKRM